MKKIKILDIKAFESSEESIDFYCNTFREHLIAHHQAISLPHKHNFYLTVLFTSGSGIHEIDFQKYTIRPGQVFLLNPGQTHYWKVSDDTDGVIFFHSKDYFDVRFSDHSVNNFPFFYSQFNPSIVTLSDFNIDRFKHLFDEILSEYGQPQSYTTQKISSLINCIYIELSRIYVQSSEIKILTPGTYTQHLRNLEILIDQNFKHEKSPDAYAQMMNMTIRHLNRLTQESLAKTTTQLITERIILEAKRLLVYASGSLSHTAYELGYEDYAYFSRLFKKWTGITPSIFSQKYRSTKNRNS